MALAANLPASLVVLNLNLLNCGCWNASAEALAEKLPADLNRLTLVLGGNGVRTSHIEWRGARALAQNLPRSLTQLSLHFGECRFGDAGAQALAEKLPSGLTELSLFLHDTGMGEYGARALADNFARLKKLKILVLCVNYN